MRTNKTLITICTIFAALTLFTSCGEPSESVYYEPWFETEGYVITKTNERTGTKSFVSFEEGTPPEGTSIAVQYDHSWIKNPRCTFYVQKLTTDLDNDIVDEFVTDDTKTDTFTIINKPYDRNTGFIFWCDAERVYVVNNLYSYGFSDAPSSKKAQYRFIISINGIKRLELYMNYKTAQAIY